MNHLLKILSSRQSIPMPNQSQLLFEELPTGSHAKDLWPRKWPHSTQNCLCTHLRQRPYAGRLAMELCNLELRCAMLINQFVPELNLNLSQWCHKLGFKSNLCTCLIVVASLSWYQLSGARVTNFFFVIRFQHSLNFGVQKELRVAFKPSFYTSTQNHAWQSVVFSENFDSWQKLYTNAGRDKSYLCKNYCFG